LRSELSQSRLDIAAPQTTSRGGLLQDRFLALTGERLELRALFNCLDGRSLSLFPADPDQRCLLTERPSSCLYIRAKKLLNRIKLAALLINPSLSRFRLRGRCATLRP
jgi:hypothetical protein